MAETFEGWAILELMCHRRLGGFVRESETELAGTRRQRNLSKLFAGFALVVTAFVAPSVAQANHYPPATGSPPYSEALRIQPGWPQYDATSMAVVWWGGDRGVYPPCAYHQTAKVYWAQPAWMPSPDTVAVSDTLNCRIWFNTEVADDFNSPTGYMDKMDVCDTAAHEWGHLMRARYPTRYSGPYSYTATDHDTANSIMNVSYKNRPRTILWHCWDAYLPSGKSSEWKFNAGGDPIWLTKPAGITHWEPLP